MEADPVLNKDSKEALGHIIKSAGRMAQVITDLMKLSNISRRILANEQTDLSEMAKSFLEELTMADKSRDVRFHVTPGIVVSGDPGLFRLLMENLIRNAWKFTANRQGALIEFGVMQKEGKAVYFIRDNGVGFDGKEADRLFKPYQRLHSQREFKGSGIGLAITKRIVNRHGGEIWAEGEKDKGATFYFQLP
jgi:light-regulated signal transduction histidine kinase (bacteriophytochrome)